MSIQQSVNQMFQSALHGAVATKIGLQEREIGESKVETAKSEAETAKAEAQIASEEADILRQTGEEAKKMTERRLNKQQPTELSPAQKFRAALNSVPTRADVNKQMAIKGVDKVKQKEEFTEHKININELQNMRTNIGKFKDLHPSTQKAIIAALEREENKQ